MSVSETDSVRRLAFYEELRRIHALSLTASAHHVFRGVLELALRHSGSTQGVVAELQGTEDRPESLRLLALVDTVGTVYDHDEPPEVTDLQTLAGAALLSGIPLLSNDPASDPRRGASEAGLRSMAAIPLWREVQLVGLLVLADRPGGYDESVLADLAPLFDSAAHLILGHRLERERHREQGYCYAALAEADHYRYLFDHANVLALIVDVNRRILQHTKAWLRTLGWSSEELRAGSISEFVHPDDRAESNRLYDLVRQGQPVRNLINRFKHRDGGWRTLSWEAVYEPSSRYIYAVADDITERRAQERRAEERQRMVQMAEGMSGVGYWYLDLTDRTVSWSEQIYRIMQLDPATDVPSIGVSVRLVHPDDRDRIKALFAECIVHHRPFDIDIRFVRRDGTQRWARVHGRPESGSDSTAHALFGVLQDVTDRLDTQSQLEEARQQALEASRTKSQFLANMSHEIRTPLNGVLGAAGLLAGTALGDEQRELLGAIQASGRLLSETINDVLDLAKIEAGKLELEERSFSLGPLVEELAQAFALSARGKKLRWSYELDPGMPARLRGDPTRLRQVMTNLVGNAIKFTARGHVSLRLSYEGGRLHGEVSDSGPGIAPDRLDAIFEPFEQADGSTTRAYGGSGLGLAICRQLVTRMGGHVECRSVVGQGTTFRFTVTLPADMAPVTLRPADKGASLPPLRLLLAEDNPINALVARKLLRQAGHAVTVVGNGLEALDALARQPFDMVLMDVQMPRMDGLEALRQLRALETPGGPHMPVVALTANAMKGDEEACYEAGADGYVVKPIDARQLWATIGQVLARR